MKILLSYDDTEISERAFEVARKQTSIMQAKLDIVTVVVRDSKDQSEDIQEAEKILTKAMKTCKLENINCQTKLIIKEGTPAEAILDYADEEKHDMIVIGIRRTSQLGKMILGSNARYVILNAQCPVLCVNKHI
jgi:nucleotide-binding universal stress UspA family protein